MGPAEVDRVATLLDTYLFEELSPAEVEPIARAAIERRLDRNEYLTRVGDPADSLWVVASGQLKDQIVTEDGDEVVHSVFGPGMVLGEPGYFAIERNRMMAVIAIEPTVILVLRRDDLTPFLTRHPAVVTRALEGLASIARGQTELIAALARRPLQERLLLRLLELAETERRPARRRRGDPEDRAVDARGHGRGEPGEHEPRARGAGRGGVGADRRPAATSFPIPNASAPRSRTEGPCSGAATGASDAAGQPEV